MFEKKYCTGKVRQTRLLIAWIILSFVLLMTSSPPLSSAATLTSISVTPANPTVNVGQSQKFTATGVYSDGSTQVIGTAVSAIAAGRLYTCATLNDGLAMCWGYNWKGQLGNGTTIDSITPIAVSGLSNAGGITAGDGNTCAVIADGTAKCWGKNHWGQLGNGTMTDSYLPVAVSGINNAVAIGTSYSHSCAVLTDGMVKCWGYNGLGQLGNGTTTDSALPVPVSGINNAISISTGKHNCAVMADGTAKCWGPNWYGQLGDGTTTDSAIPVNVIGINNAVAIATEDDYTCALLLDGKVMCWGNNDEGQLGNGTMVNSTIPVAVSGINNAISITTGCAILSDGTVKCWGRNGYGQLGNGTTTNSAIPVLVNGLYDAVAISSGAFHTCAILLDGTVQCWGDNSSGQFGNGTITSSFVPVTTSGISNAAIPVQWTSSNSGVASIYGNGFAKGISPGTAMITASVSGITGITTLTVDLSDATPPTGSIVINNNAVWTKSTSATLTLNCTDNVDGSGCADMQLSRDGVFDTEVWEAYLTNKAGTLATGNGNRRVYVRFRDAAGNISIIYSDSIKLDMTRPVVSNVSDTPDPFNHHLGEKTTISFTVSDNLSLTCDITVKIYNASNVLVKTINKTGASCPTAGAVSSVTWYGRNSSNALVPAGTYTYKIEAKDKALNYSLIQSGTVTVQ